MAGTELKEIAIGQIRENPDAIRVVNRKAEGYLGLVESIKAIGFTLSTITVRPFVEGGETFYVVCDGMHRYLAAKDCGLDVIPCQISTMEDDAAVEASIMANVHRKDTSASEYRSGLLNILQRNPMMTEAELAVRLAKSPTWVQNMLRLNKIENDEIIALIDGGAISLANAYALAKLPAEEQVNFLTDAQTLSPEEFCPKVAARSKEIKDAKRRGEDPNAATFTPAEFMQKMTVVKEQRDSGEVGNALIAETGVSTAAEGFALALNWMLHADVFSVAEQKGTWEAKEAARAEKKRQRAVEKAAKDKEKAQVKLEEAAKAEAAIAG